MSNAVVALLTLASNVITARGTSTVTGRSLTVNCTVWSSTTIVVGPPPSWRGSIALLNQMQVPPAMAVRLNFAGIETVSHGL